MFSCSYCKKCCFCSLFLTLSRTHQPMFEAREFLIADQKLYTPVACGYRRRNVSTNDCSPLPFRNSSNEARS